MQCEDSTTVRSLRGRWPWHLKTRRKEIGSEASAAIHLIESIGLEANHGGSSGTSTSSIWHHAMTLYIKQLPEEDQQSIISTEDDSALTAQSIETLILPLIAKHKHGAVVKLLVKLGPTLQHIRSFATVLDVAVQSHPNVASLIWGGVRLILEVCPPAEYLHAPLMNICSLSSRYHLERSSY